MRDLVDQPEGWQARHFAVAPFGGLLSTWLWVTYGPAWAQFDNFGVLFYGAVAVLLEGGYQMFYAISKRRRDINAAEDRGRAAGRQEGIQEGRQAGRQEGIQEGRQAGRQEGRQEGIQEGNLAGRRAGRAAALDALSARLKDDPNANPMEVIAELRDKTENGPQ